MVESDKILTKLEKCFENLKKAKWKASKPRLLPPISARKFSAAEKKIGHRFPSEYRNILTQAFSGVQFSWSSGGHSDERYLVGKHTSVGKVSFNPTELLNFKDGPINWIKKMDLSPSQQKTEIKRWKNKLPIVECKTGDFITLDLAGNHEVHWFFHEGTNDSGTSFKPLRLAKSFPDFLSIWGTFGFLETMRLMDNFDIDEKKWKKISDVHYENSQILELLTLGRYKKWI